MRFIKRYKRIIIWLMSVICVFAIFLAYDHKNRLGIFNSAVSYLVTPVQKIIFHSEKWIDSKITLITDMIGMENENIALKQEIEIMKLRTMHLKILQEENDKLFELLKLSKRFSNYNTVAANVIAKDVGNWYDTFTIDKGKSDGMVVNMPVISVGGLVGRIVECGPNYSRVVSIINDNSSISAKNNRTDDIGFVKGDLELKNDGLCKMEYIDNSSEIIEGDEVVTSHLSEIFPPGITIGKVKSIIMSEQKNERYAIIEPIADLKHLDTVLIFCNVSGENSTELEE